MVQLSDQLVDSRHKIIWSRLKREAERLRNGASADTRMLCFAEQSPWLERTGREGMLEGRAGLFCRL